LGILHQEVTVNAGLLVYPIGFLQNHSSYGLNQSSKLM